MPYNIFITFLGQYIVEKGSKPIVLGMISKSIHEGERSMISASEYGMTVVGGNPIKVYTLMSGLTSKYRQDWM